MNLINHRLSSTLSILGVSLSILIVSSSAVITRADNSPSTGTVTTTTTRITNGSSATGYPHYVYHQGQPQPGIQVEVGSDPSRDPRQWLAGGYGGYPGYGGGLGLGLGGTEMLLTCLLVILGIGVIGLPFLLLIFSAFTGGQGVNFIPPTTTTTVAGRKKREVESMFPKINPDVQSKLFGILETFMKASDKMKHFKNMVNNHVN